MAVFGTMTDKNCIVCNQPLSQELFEGLDLHKSCFTTYQNEVEEQEGLLIELRSLFGNNLWINSDSTTYEDKLNGLTIPQSLEESGQGTDYNMSISLENGYVTSISLEGSDRNDSASQSSFMEISERNLFAKGLELITLFNRVEEIEVSNIGNIGFVQANFSRLLFLVDLQLENVSFTLASGCFTLSIFPESICSITGLKELDVHQTNITEIPNRICKLSELTFLNLSDNKITYLPDCLNLLTHLGDLDLSNNRLTTCSMIHSVPDLYSINISNNNITDISSLATNPSLTSIEADYNRITTIPSSFQNILLFKELSLIDNIIQDIPDLRQLPNLRSLFGFHKN